MISYQIRDYYHLSDVTVTQCILTIVALSYAGDNVYTYIDVLPVFGKFGTH